MNQYWYSSIVYFSSCVILLSLAVPGPEESQLINHMYFMLSLVIPGPKDLPLNINQKS